MGNVYEAIERLQQELDFYEEALPMVTVKRADLVELLVAFGRLENMVTSDDSKLILAAEELRQVNTKGGE